MINLLARTVLSACLLSVLPTVSAASAPTVSRPVPAATVASDEAIDFNFDGGFTEELFSQLSEAFPAIQIVIESKAKNFYVPAFSARVTDPMTILELVCSMESWRRDEEGARVRGLLEMRGVNGELVFVSFVPWTNLSLRSPTILVEVISIQELLTSGMGVEEIFGTVEAGIALWQDGRAGAASEALVRFHEKTGVLFVKGTKSVNGMVAQTVEALKASARWRVSDEAIAAKEALIRAEALDSLGEATKEAARMQSDKLEQLKKDHEALMERQRQVEDERDARQKREFEAEDAGNEDA